MSMTVYEAVADAVVREGTRTIFGLMGDANMELLGELTRQDVEFVKVRHEQGAAAMADGYSRASGSVGVCTVTCGPGLINASTSLAVARRHRSPVVVIAGASPLGDPGHLQSFDQQSLGATMAGTTISVTGPEEVGRCIADAFAAARSGGGPVLVNLPMDVQASAVTEPWHYVPASAAPDVDLPLPDVSAAVAAIAGAERPAMIVGRGALVADAEAAVLDLAEAAGAPFVTTMQATGIGGGHALSLGNAGLMGSPAAFAVIRDADCLIVVGASLYRLTTGFGALVEDTQVVLVDSDPAAAPKADVFVCGDARAISEALSRELRARSTCDPSAAAGGRMPTDSYPFEPDHGAGTVDPRSAFVELDRILPPDRVIVMDAGHFISFAGPLLRIPSPDSWVFPTDLGCIGQSLSAAIGVAKARPGQRVTVVAGDAGFLMGISELETAARLGLPITFFIINDEAWGQEAHVLAMKGGDPELAMAPTPDLSALAGGFGANGYRIAGPEDLRGLQAAIAAARGPLVVDVRVNPRVRNWVIEQFALVGHDITETAGAAH
jgi:thiamine pyrophosphate-dependent acetolactate synthase large subunit-like protein